MSKKYSTKFKLLIDGAALIKNFKPLIGRSGYSVSEMGTIELRFADGFLVIDSRVFQVRVAASGIWREPVTVAPGPFMKTLKRVPAEPDIYCVWNDGCLSIAGRIVPC
jgi:hypothetical protein